MLRAIRLFAALAVALAAPASETLAGANNKHQARYSVGYHGDYRQGFHAGYRDGYESGYRQAARRISPYPSAPPVEGFAAAVLGATYGYWSDGVRVYGGDPCYQYNDRDWAFERVC